MIRGGSFFSTIYKNLASQEGLYMVKGGWVVYHVEGKDLLLEL